MSTKISQSCLDDIQRMQRQFIWGDSYQIRRWNVVGWDKVALPKYMGGLWLRDLQVMNQVCLIKID